MEVTVSVVATFSVISAIFNSWNNRTLKSFDFGRYFQDISYTHQYRINVIAMNRNIGSFSASRSLLFRAHKA